MAIGHCGAPEGLIHHSDGGSQYASKKYRKLLERHGIEQSMSGRGNCYDNAFVESFFGKLKTEFVYRYAWRTRQHAAEAISTWIGVRYNSRRGHSALDWLSSIEFENAIADGQSVAA